MCIHVITDSCRQISVTPMIYMRKYSKTGISCNSSVVCYVYPGKSRQRSALYLLRHPRRSRLYLVHHKASCMMYAGKSTLHNKPHHVRFIHIKIETSYNVVYLVYHMLYGMKYPFTWGSYCTWCTSETKGSYPSHYNCRIKYLLINLVIANGTQKMTIPTNTAYPSPPSLRFLVAYVGRNEFFE